MSRRKRETFDNSLTQLVEGVEMGSRLTGGSFLSNYNTIAHSNNYSLITLNRIVLTYFYTTVGVFQTAIQLPVQDALSKGVEIESSEMDSSDIDLIYEYWEEVGLIEKVMDAWTWGRLYGGGGLLINTNQDPDKPFDIKSLDKTPIEFYDIDRWQMDTNGAYTGEMLHSKDQDDEFIRLWGMPIHESRFLMCKGKRAPSYVRQQLRGWGMSEGERMIRDINLYLKTQDVLYEVVDEAKIDIYQIKDLAKKLMQRGGTDKITARVQMANQLKSYVNALVLDTEENYEQKTMQFTGIAEVMKENKMGVASALRMPMTKLFGMSSSGFNAGEDDLEQYNQMVESEIRSPLTPWMRKLIKISCQHLFGYEPSFKIKWPAMRVLKETEEQQVKDAKLNRFLSMYDRGIITSEEFAQMASKEGILTIETKAEQGLIDEFPERPGDDEQRIRPT